jgi:outer membrane protein OmpA-like peptidoglycan-associated protein
MLTNRCTISARWSMAALAIMFSCSLAHAAPPPLPIPSVERSALVASYGIGAITKANLKGTDLVPNAKGTVKVAAKQGTVRLSVSVRNLPPAAGFGPEYLTYVLWAITAEGRPRNLGEIVVTKGAGKLETTTPIQAFGLVVTAEPYFALGTPGEMIVLRNDFSGASAAQASPAEVRFLTFARGTFAGASALTADPQAKPPADLLQAQNALRIARDFRADSYAGDLCARAAETLTQAEAFLKDKKNKRFAAPKAREAVQSAEAARALAVSASEEERIAEERAAAAARATEAQARAADAEASATAASATAAEEATRRAEAERLAAQSDQARLRAEAEKQTLRAKLLRQLNLILETRDSARGLIVSMGDVLFDLEKYTLRPQAREKLAKLSGVLLGNAGLTLAVEGHTDSTGSDEYNQKLSENRAGTVRDYLIEQGVSAESITARGFGRTRPVASNASAEGRQKNRRVEIVVSGEAIGVETEE